MKHGAGGASTGGGGGGPGEEGPGGGGPGEEGPGGGELDGCIMHRVHTSVKRNKELIYMGNFSKSIIWLSISKF